MRHKELSAWIMIACCLILGTLTTAAVSGCRPPAESVDVDLSTEPLDDMASNITGAVETPSSNITSSNMTTSSTGAAEVPLASATTTPATTTPATTLVNSV